MPLIGRKNLDKAIGGAVKQMNNNLIGIYTKGLAGIVFATPVHFKDGGNLWG